MTSINTNIAATTALRTLQSTNAQLDQTQSRISTGLKIGEAKDNAAYWSIATTLKSDNKALGTVKDALNLGSAAVDVAYQGLNAAKAVLDEIKSKLTTAASPSADKSKIQSELAELQKQLVAIAGNASFSGENWLSVNSTNPSFEASKNVVSGYTRDASGSVSISTIEIDISKAVLIDNGANKEGILNGGFEGNSNRGGLATAESGATALLGAATKGTDVTGALSAVTTAADGQTWEVALKIDGKIETFSGTFDGATFTATATADELGAAVQNALRADTRFAGLANVTYNSAGTTDAFTFESDKVGLGSKIEFTSLTVAGAAATVAAGTGAVDGVNAKATVTAAFDNATNGLALDDNDTVSFDVSVSGGADKRVTITKNLIDQVLQKGDGKVTSVDDYKLVLREALRVSGLPEVVVGDTAGQISLSAGTAIEIKNVEAGKGFNLTSFDISNMSSQQMSSLLTSVNSASELVTSAAANLGAVASRIDLQKTFVNTLIDTIDQGISGLIDADMNEESTRLQALQVKQQLGVQALSIANQSAQNVLRLFQ